MSRLSGILCRAKTGDTTRQHRYIAFESSIYARLAQLGEYSPYKRGVIGSSPIFCTKGTHSEMKVNLSIIGSNPIFSAKF